MAGAKRTCVTCGDKFIGRARAQYCSAACRQRAHRERRGGNRNAGAVTKTVSGPEVHGPEAAALLQALDAELAQRSDAMGLPPEQSLEWSAVELMLLATIADSLDRKGDLYARYRDADDDNLRVKLSGEIRLLETAVERMLRRVHTELPAAPSLTSVKAQRAANTRWARDATN